MTTATPAYDPLSFYRVFPYKYYSIDRITLSFARVLLRELDLKEDMALRDMPKRHSMTPEDLEEAESKVFREFIDRRYELGMLIELFQKERTAKSVATKKAKRDLLVLEQKKVIARVKSAALTPEQKMDKKIARAQRKAEKAFKESLMTLI